MQTLPSTNNIGRMSIRSSRLSNMESHPGKVRPGVLNFRTVLRTPRRAGRTAVRGNFPSGGVPP